MAPNGVNKKIFQGVQMPASGVTRGEDPNVQLHPYASHYDYIGEPQTAEGIFEGTQTSPWIQVPRPSDWYRGPWQKDIVQTRPYRRQPRKLNLTNRGGAMAPAGTSVSGCGSCGGLAGDATDVKWIPLLGLLGLVAYVMWR